MKRKLTYFFGVPNEKNCGTEHGQHVIESKNIGEEETIMTPLPQGGWKYTRPSSNLTLLKPPQRRKKVPKSGGAHRHVIYAPSVKNQYKRVVFGYMVIY